METQKLKQILEDVRDNIHATELAAGVCYNKNTEKINEVLVDLEYIDDYISNLQEELGALEEENIMLNMKED